MNKFLFTALILFFSLPVFSQTDLKRPEASQKAMVMQRIGLTDITITYHSPLSKGRKIWGDLVPYGEVWRAGANDNTTISFSTDVTVEGKPLKAGTYGLHMIPGEKQWTIIFNSNAGAWGSFFYRQEEDVLRVSVTPETMEDQAWLSYVFTNPLEQSVTAELRWASLAIPFQIGVDVPETVYQSMKQELSYINGFFWQGHNQAAAYCIQHHVHLDDAEKWIDKSIGLQKNFANLNTKARLLEITGKAAAADAMRKEALALADEAQLNAYGYQLINEKKLKEAIAVFKLNIKKYPASWNAYDSLGEALLLDGDKEGSKTNYKTALSRAPQEQKKRIEDILKKI